MIGSAVRAEWTKLRMLPGTWWLALVAIVVMVAISAAADTTAGLGIDPDPVRLGLSGVEIAQAVVAILAVLAVSAEYGTGMIATTLAAVPRRPVLLTAKLIIVSAIVFVTAVVAVVGCVVLGHILISGAVDRHTFRAAAGSVLYLVLIALFSCGVTVLVRDSAVAIGVVLGVLYLFPILAAVVTDPVWQRHIQQIGPMTAGLAIQATVDLSQAPIGPWTGLGVLALWTVLAILAGLALLAVRDA